MNHLTSSDNIKLTAARFVSSKLDDNRIDPYIDECEQINIKSQIGESLFIDLVDYVNAEDKSGYPVEYDTLLNGGTYEAEICGSNYKRQLNGLVKSLNYYVWSKIVKNNNYTVTRYATVTKVDDYSKNAELKERLVLEKDALTVADKYLMECIDYLKAKSDKFPLFNISGSKPKFNNRLNIKIIGD